MDFIFSSQRYFLCTRIIVVLGEFGNFLAYNIAPAVIVTPLGALGVLFGYALFMLQTTGVSHVARTLHFTIFVL